MYRVAICDDEPVFLSEFRKLISDICERNAIQYEVTLFKDPMGLLKAIHNAPEGFDVLFLDIIMDNLNGMDLAQRIRALNPSVTIVFITSTPGFAMAGYNVRARHYLLKPVNNDMLEHLVLEDSKRLEPLYLNIESSNGVVRLPVCDIEYIETVGRKVSVVTNNDTFAVTGKLSDVLSGLPDDVFIRCHQSFALNLKKTKEIDARHAVSETGKLVPISRSYLKDIQRMFLKGMKK